MSRFAERHITTCRECHTRVAFAQTPAGKRCPFDAAPVPEGRYIIAAWGGTLDPPYVMAKFDDSGPLIGGDDPDQPRYHSHFTTCTKPSRFSKKGTQ